MLLKVNKSCRGQTKPCRGKTYSRTNPHITEEAFLFSASLNDAFVVALEVLVSVLEVTKPLSVRLQGATQEIHNVSESVRDCITILPSRHVERGVRWGHCPGARPARLCQFFHDFIECTSICDAYELPRPRL